MFDKLTEVQTNVLIASIIGDGELTKLYKNSRRKNSCYREHYGEKQMDYRIWKAQLMGGMFYITPKSQSLRSSSSPFFTELFKLFYKNDKKTIPHSLLSSCNLPHFLAIIYMDDGTLSISHRVNHNSKTIYITPHIYLYLQNYSKDDLIVLKNHIRERFDLELHLGNRKDGYGTILRTTSVEQVYKFLFTIKNVAFDCPSMFYKTHWDYRLKQEIQKWEIKHPDYQLIATSSNRHKNHSDNEVKNIIRLKKDGLTDNGIAQVLGRSYWSIVYKLKELRKKNLLK